MFNSNSRILIVDDMAIVRRILRKLLGDLGFDQVEEAGDGDEAWQLIERGIAENKAFTLVLCDLNMPRLDGLRLLERVRHDTRTGSMSFVMMSGEHKGPRRAAADGLGLSAFLPKPFTPDTLRDALQAAYSNVKKAA